MAKCLSLVTVLFSGATVGQYGRDSTEGSVGDSVEPRGPRGQIEKGLCERANNCVTNKVSTCSVFQVSLSIFISSLGLGEG